MSWTITPQTKVPVDPQFGSVLLLLHGGQSGGQFVDTSPSPKTITKVGNVAPGSPGGGTPIYPSSNSAFGSAIAFDGSEDALTVNIGSLNTRTDAFTFESWAYITTRTNFCLLSGSNFYLQEVSGTVYLGDGGANPLTFSATELPLSSWFHIAISFDATTYKVFVNGIQKGSTSTLLQSFNFSSVRIGDRSNASITGYLDDFRITKGVARYTSNFTPPTAPFPDI